MKQSKLTQKWVWIITSVSPSYLAHGFNHSFYVNLLSHSYMVIWSKQYYECFCGDFFGWNWYLKQWSLNKADYILSLGPWLVELPNGKKSDFPWTVFVLKWKLFYESPVCWLHVYILGLLNHPNNMIKLLFESITFPLSPLFQFPHPGVPNHYVSVYLYVSKEFLIQINSD